MSWTTGRNPFAGFLVAGTCELLLPRSAFESFVIFHFHPFLIMKVRDP